MSKKFQFPIDKVLNPEQSNDPVRISSYFDWSKFSGFLEDCKSNQIKEVAQGRKRKITKPLSVGCSPLLPNKHFCLNNKVEKNKQNIKRRATSFSEPSVSYLSNLSSIAIPIKPSIFLEKKAFGHSYFGLEKDRSSLEAPEQNIKTYLIDSPTGLSHSSAFSENLSPLTVYDCGEGSGAASNTSSENGFQISIEPQRAGYFSEKHSENEENPFYEPTPAILSSNQIIEGVGRVAFLEDSQDNAITTFMESSPPNFERPSFATEPSDSSNNDDLSSKPCFQPDFNSNEDSQIHESEFLGQPIELIEALLKISSYTPENSSNSRNSSGSFQSSAASLVHSDNSALNILSLAAMAVEQKHQLYLNDSNHLAPAYNKQITYLSSTENTVTISRAEFRRLIALQALISQVDELRLLEFLLNSS